MILLLSIIAAIVPTILYTSLIYWVDRYEKEPLWLLISAFLWGAIPSIIAAFIVNTGFSIPFYLIDETIGEFISAALIAPFVEESLKGFALLGIFFLWRRELDSYLDGMIYGAVVGMGFAMVENVFYFQTTYLEAGLEAWSINIFMRAVLFGLNHALFTSMTGLGIGTARLTHSKVAGIAAIVGGWAIAVTLHAIHNAAATFGGSWLLLVFLNAVGGGIVTLTIIAWSLWQEGKWIKEYLIVEAKQGVLTTRQHEAASSILGRFLESGERLFTLGFRGYWQTIRFYERCAKLAYKKHHFELFAHDKDLTEIEVLRGEIAGISRQMKR